MKNRDEFNLRIFKRWLGNKELNVVSMTEYRMELNKMYSKPASIRMKWFTAKKYFVKKKEAKYGMEYIMKELYWIDYCNPNRKGNIERAYLITENEYKMLIENDRSCKRICWMKYIWKTGKRVTDVINALNDNFGISDNLYKEILKEFNSGKYLFETSTSKQYSRNYISSELKKIGLRIIGKEISAESFRTNHIIKNNISG